MLSVMSRFAITLLVLATLTSGLSAQNSTPVVVGAEIGVGYTVVDLAAALEWDEQYFEDWDQVYGRVEAHAFFFRAGPVLLGASVAWNRLYYYWVRVPYVPSPLVYEGTVQPLSVGAVGEIGVGDQLRLRIGSNIMIFGDGVAAGFRASGFYDLPFAETLRFSIGATADLILGSGIPFGIGLVAGIDYPLGP